MATRADLRNRVLKALKVVAAGETASAEDATDVEETITDMQLQLENQEGAYWVDGDYPDELLVPLTKIMAYEASDKFGIGGQEQAAYAFKSAEGYRDLRRHLSVRKDDRPVAAEYF